MASKDADMGSGLDDEEALSDFEEDDLEAAPVVLVPSPTNVTSSVADSLKSALAELEKERQAREAAEATNVEADSQIKRLKTFVHETLRQRDEALKSKEECTRLLEQALQSKDEITRQRDEIITQRDEARETSKSEIAEVARILVTQAEKIMSMANGVKNFSGGLPRFPNTTGLAAIALGFGKRMEEVVEEVLRQREEAVRRRDEIHAQMEQRNFSIAIEVSELEASITGLKLEVAEKSLELEKSQKQGSEVELSFGEQLRKIMQEIKVLKGRVEEAENQLQVVNKCVTQNVQYTAKARASLLDVLEQMRYAPFENDSEISVTDGEAGQEELLAGGRALVELASRVGSAWKERMEAFDKQKEDWDANVKMLLEEKDDLVSKMIYLENGNTAVEDSQSDFRSHRGHTGTRGLSKSSVRLDRQESAGGNEGVSSRESEAANESVSSNQDNSDLTDDCTDALKLNDEAPLEPSLEVLQEELAALERRYHQVVSKTAALETEVRSLQQELQRTTSSARAEIDKLQTALDGQAKDLSEKVAQIQELEKDAKEHIETYTNELEAAEEEVARWKEAATAEAAAGAAVLEELEKRNKEIATLSERILELKEMVEEANNKVSSKEQMAMAASAARNAAERSLQIADERASDLRHRVEDMTRALEDLEQGGEYRVQGLLDMCWPWLRGRGRPGLDGAEPRRVRGSAEMEELLEPLV